MSNESKSRNFLQEIIDRDLESGLHTSVLTRFPPEPNGYLHIGHAKSICLNFGLAQQYGGACNLRYDDTNPAKEDEEYVRSIEQDIKWLGFEWKDKLLSAMPDLDTADDRLYTIPGSPPNLLHEKQGDAFAPRNHFALNIDDEVDPPMFKISDTHYAATWLLDPRAPKVDMPPELAQRIARMRAEAEKIKEAE